MTYEESIPIAKRLAEKSLEKGFDVEAFLVLSEIKKLEKQETPKDDFPDTEVDNYIVDINTLFEDYYNSRQPEKLNLLLTTIRKMLGELFRLLETQEEKEIFFKCLYNIETITETLYI